MPLPSNHASIVSPTPSLLETNGVPLPADRTRIKAAIQAAEEQLKAFTKEDLVRVLVEELLTGGEYWTLLRISYLNDFVRKHKALLSPVRNLPPELLGEIFRFVVLPRRFHTSSSVALPKEPAHNIAYAITQTCKYWRDVALSIPQLWTSIPPLQYPYPYFHRRLSFMRLFLERSKDLPIHVIISMVHWPFLNTLEAEDSLPDFSRLPSFNLLFSQAHRWGTAVVHLDRRIYETLPSFDFPQLTHLNLRVNEESFPASLLDCPNHVFQRTPLLKHIVLDNVQKHPHMGQLLHNVESYAGLPIALDYFAFMYKNLRRCELRGPVSIMYYSDFVIPFPKLEYLRVASTNYRELSGAWSFGRNPEETPFRYIKAPKLKELEIEAHPVHPTASLIVKDLLAVTLRKTTQLRALTFHVVGWTEEEFHRLLAATPFLERLDIWDTPATYLKRLVFDASEGAPGALVPRLRSLVIRGFSDTDFATLERLRDSRHLADPSVKNLHRELSITLTYRTVKKFMKAQNIIEGWTEVEPGNHMKGSECTMVLGWSSHLVKSFFRWPVPNPADKKFGVACSAIQATGKGLRRLRASNWDMSKLSHFLSIVETHEFGNPELLEPLIKIPSAQSTRILRIMEVIRDMSPAALMRDEVYLFRYRAAALVEKWTPLVEESRKCRRWKLSDDCKSLRLA
ncbi:unnamed protein product [Cyclocybe aegerita]|uniref:F-box domain-containing protein n=1 Tax=Cyclocybe aegerita TaxID=1973307 RepID=A0A8S0WLN8_CYCAE|nr:unnamed protein product [Cyclocybe aegerita]